MSETVETRALGKSGIEVSALGMGCMGITHASGDPMADDDAVRVIRAAHEMGYTLFDTAECYVGMHADSSPTLADLPSTVSPSSPPAHAASKSGAPAASAVALMRVLRVMLCLLIFNPSTSEQRRRARSLFC